MPASLMSMAALLACASASFAFWVSGGALAVTAGPASPRVALLPPWWLLALVAVAAAGAIVAWRPRAGTTLPLWGALILLRPWLPFSVPAPMLLWIGPARVWLCLAIAFAVLAAARPSLAAEMPS